MVKKKIYFAYGSNLNLMQMHERCPDAEKIGSALLEGYCLAFKGNTKGRAYLTIEKREGAFVPIGVFYISERDEKRLDAYEGYPTFYGKEKITLPLQTKEKKELPDIVTGLIYVMNPRYTYNEPSSYYLEACLQGYKEFQFDYDVLRQALSETKIEKKNQLKRTFLPTNNTPQKN